MFMCRVTPPTTLGSASCLHTGVCVRVAYIELYSKMAVQVLNVFSFDVTEKSLLLFSCSA